MKTLLCLFLSVASLAITPLAFAVEKLAEPITFSITDATSQTGVHLQTIDLQGALSGTYNARDRVAVEVEVVTNGTAPGASRTLTVYYGLSARSSLTAAEMATAASNQVNDLPNAANTTRIYTLPVVYISGRYLYLWFDHTARDASSELTVTIKTLGVGR
jgi:hypothetical protein